MSRIAIITDAAPPQINGVVRTLQNTVEELCRMGHDVRLITPDMVAKRIISLPGYHEIQLGLGSGKALARTLVDFDPHYTHISTEGPLGWAARSYCLKHRKPFTTAYHTKFPEYFAERVPKILRHITLALAYRILRSFHGPASAVMVASPTLRAELAKRRFHRIVPWSRGVDSDLFHPDAIGADDPYTGLKRPIIINMGRVAVEKNLPVFLGLDLPGTKVVVGGGPALEHLRRDYPATTFTGSQTGHKLARLVAAADIFVFPSLTDTFGLVVPEALACGVPVAAYNVPGPGDILGPSQCRAFSRLSNATTAEGLRAAIIELCSLHENGAIDRAAARAHALTYTWRGATEQFCENLQADTPRARRRILHFNHALKPAIWARRVLRRAAL